MGPPFMCGTVLIVSNNVVTILCIVLSCVLMINAQSRPESVTENADQQGQIKFAAAGAAHGGGGAHGIAGEGARGGGGGAAEEAARGGGGGADGSFAAAAAGGPAEINGADGGTFMPPEGYAGDPKAVIPAGQDPPPGFIYVPKGEMAGGVPHVDPKNDPPDSDLNKPFYWIILPNGVQQHWIHKYNPCQKYKENLDSTPNSRRRKGCRNELKRMKSKIRRFGKSPNCPKPTEAKCLQVSKQSGRCYVNVEDGKSRKWVIIETCKNCQGGPDVCKPCKSPKKKDYECY